MIYSNVLSEKYFCVEMYDGSATMHEVNCAGDESRDIVLRKLKLRSTLLQRAPPDSELSSIISWALTRDTLWHRPQFGGEKDTFMRPLPEGHFFTKKFEQDLNL